MDEERAIAMSVWEVGASICELVYAYAESLYMVVLSALECHNYATVCVRCMLL